MQHQSPTISRSSSRFTPPSNLSLRAPVISFNTGFYDPGPNEIDPLDCSYLSDDIPPKTDAPGDFTFPTERLATVRSPFEQQRYCIAPRSSVQTPLLSGCTEAPSTSGSTPSPVLLWTPRSPHVHDSRRSHPLRDKRAHDYELITLIVFSANPFFQNASPLTCTGRFIQRIKATQIPYILAIDPPTPAGLSKRISHLHAPRPRP
jgi:hypothetical protein